MPVHSEQSFFLDADQRRRRQPQFASIALANPPLELRPASQRLQAQAMAKREARGRCVLPSSCPRPLMPPDSRGPQPTRVPTANAAAASDENEARHTNRPPPSQTDNTTYGTRRVARVAEPRADGATRVRSWSVWRRWCWVGEWERDGRGGGGWSGAGARRWHASTIHLIDGGEEETWRCRRPPSSANGPASSGLLPAPPPGAPACLPPTSDPSETRVTQVGWVAEGASERASERASVRVKNALARRRGLSQKRGIPPPGCCCCCCCCGIP